MKIQIVPASIESTLVAACNLIRPKGGDEDACKACAEKLQRLFQSYQRGFGRCDEALYVTLEWCADHWEIGFEHADLHGMSVPGQLIDIWLRQDAVIGDDFWTWHFWCVKRERGQA